MKRLICIVLLGLVLIPLSPNLAFASEEPQVSTVRTVWEDACTLTSFHEDGKVNSTFFSFPKVIWNGSQWVDYIFASSDMSGGIGSVYVKFRPTHATIYDPNRTEVRIQDERWIAEWYDESVHRWRPDESSYDEISYTTNSFSICFIRTSTLRSGSVLKVSYILKKGAKLKYLIELTSATTRKYRIVWKLAGINGTRARSALATEDVTNTKIVRNTARTPTSWIQFLDNLNNTKVSLNWIDTFWFNKTTEKYETCFQGLEFSPDTFPDHVQASVWFGNFTLSEGETAYLDPTTDTFESEASLDGYIYKYAEDEYPPSQEIHVVTGNEYIIVGQIGIQDRPPYPYYQYRGYVSFYTFQIKSFAYDLSAKLKLKTHSDESDTDFVMKAMGGEQPIYEDSLTTDDWERGTTEITTWNTANYPGDDVYIDLTISPDQINKVGRTQFKLNSNREGIRPDGYEFVRFYSGDSPDNEPRLEVTYYIDTEPINGKNWYYRNVSGDNAVIILFGGYTYDPYDFVKIKCIDDSDEKTKEKIEFIDGLVANGFSVLSNKDNPVTYKGEYNWLKDAVLWLRNDEMYKNIYLFGFSAGGVAVAYEIQKSYAGIYISTAVIASAHVDWDEISSDEIFQSAHTAAATSVCTSFIAPEDDLSYTQMESYYDNMTVHKEWHRWNDGHDPFPRTCADCGKTVLDVAVDWYQHTHTLTISASSGGTTDPVPGNYEYDAGTSVEVTAIPDDGWNFDYWYLDGQPKSANPITVTMYSDRTLEAHFEEDIGGCPYVYTWNGTGYVLDNNVLGMSEVSNGSDVEDFYRLEQAMVPFYNGTHFSAYSLMLGEFENEHSYIDKVRLYAVDHDPNVNVAVTPDGEILTYSDPNTPISAIDNYGYDWVSSLLEPDDIYYRGFPEDYLLLDFGTLDVSEAAKLVLRANFEFKKDTCIHVQVLNETSEWTDAAVLRTRQHWSTIIVDLADYLPNPDGTLKIRLYFTGIHKIDYVGLDTTPQADVTTFQTSAVRAIHSTWGRVTLKLLLNDQVYAELVPGEQIELKFILPNNTEEARTFIIYIEGHYVTTP